MRFSLWSAAAFVALSLAGCGGRTIVTPDLPGSTDAPSEDPSPTTPRAPFKQPGTGSGQQNASALLHDVSTAFNQMTGYRALLETVDRKDGKTVTVRSSALFSKPEVLRVEILSNTDNPGQAGTKALWHGGNTVEVRPSGLLGFAKVTLSTGDDRVKTLNGYRLDQINVRSAINTLLSPRAQVKVLGNAFLGPRPITLVDVSGATMTADIDHQRVGIDQVTKLPISVDLLKGTAPRYSIRLLNMALKAPGSSEMTI